MAPRVRRQAPDAPGTGLVYASSACSFAEVPTGVLQHILGFLDARKDRHRAALVCRQWHDCVHSPELCGKVEAGGWGSPAVLNSLALWLRRHGQHVHSLRLTAQGEDDLGLLPPEEALLLGCCLTTCAAVGQLRRLSIRANSMPVLSAWVQPLRSLQELSLVTTTEIDSGGLHFTCSLEHHTQLTALCLEAESLTFADGVRLPPSLRRMQLRHDLDWALPSQMSALTQLSGLRLMPTRYWDAGNFDVLLRLPALRSLHILDVYRLPSCLDQLTGLEELVLIQNAEVYVGDDLHEQLNEALRQLVFLTSLYLDFEEIQDGLPALASLQRLQRLCLGSDGYSPPNLPGGQWLSGLRELGVGWPCLRASAQALVAAAQLERIAVLSGLHAEVGHSRSLFSWLDGHPPLRRLEFYQDGDTPSRMRNAVARLQQHRPGLQVDLIEGDLRESNFVAEFHTMKFFCCTAAPPAADGTDSELM